MQSRRGFIFNIAECYGVEEFGHSFYDSHGLTTLQGLLGQGWPQEEWELPESQSQHCCNGLGTLRRAPTSRSNGKGQQTLSVSKAWAKAQPFIHY